jgi:hypothetical protein
MDISRERLIVRKRREDLVWRNGAVFIRLAAVSGLIWEHWVLRPVWIP